MLSVAPAYGVQLGRNPWQKNSRRIFYRVVDVVGVSEKSWEDARRKAVETAAGSLRDLRVAEMTKMDMRLDNGKVRSLSHPRSALFQIRALKRHSADPVGAGRAAAAMPTRCVRNEMIASSLRDAAPQSWSAKTIEFPAYDTDERRANPQHRRQGRIRATDPGNRELKPCIGEQGRMFEMPVQCDPG